MTIEDQFNIIANEYDQNRRKFIPCFDEFYGLTTDFIAANINSPKCVLDLGAGTGILTGFWYRHFPKSKYILVDIAGDMLDVAKKRFAGLENVKYEILDYSKQLPQDNFDCIVSALSIHHLTDEQKLKLFESIYERLPIGGVFVNYDQFCGGSSEINSWFDSYWENQLKNNNLTEEDIRLWKERRKLDKECSAEEETAMLSKCGFKEVKCVYSRQKFAVVAAVKGKL